jgi:hypothetical protein
MTIKHMRFACWVTEVTDTLQSLQRISKFIYLPTDAQLNCLKNDFKIYIKIYIKTSPTCFGAITIIREHTI